MYVGGLFLPEMSFTACFIAGAKVVIKFNINRNLIVNGILDVQGTVSDSVVFTSIYDDNYGGDTNGDAWATTPAPGQWGGIRFYNSNNTLDYCLLRYGGSDGLIYIENCFPTITHCTIEYSGSIGIYVNGFPNHIRVCKIICVNDFFIRGKTPIFAQR